MQIDSNQSIKTAKHGLELVASESGVALTDAYATVLTVSDVSMYKYLLLYIKNAGGGSGDDILQWQLKATKPDLSIVYTALNDASGIAADAFNSNTGYLIGPGETIDGFFFGPISIIAKCDTGEDTTADALIFGVRW